MYNFRCASGFLNTIAFTYQKKIKRQYTRHTHGKKAKKKNDGYKISLALPKIGYIPCSIEQVIVCMSEHCSVSLKILEVTLIEFKLQLKQAYR